MKDSLNLDLKCALLLPPNHSLLVVIKCSDGMCGSARANTFCAQFVGHTVDTALAKCRAALRGTHPEVGMRLRAGLPLERRRAVYMRHSPSSLVALQPV